MTDGSQKAQTNITVEHENGVIKTVILVLLFKRDSQLQASACARTHTHTHTHTHTRSSNKQMLYKVYSRHGDFLSDGEKMTFFRLDGAGAGIDLETHWVAIKTFQ